MNYITLKSVQNDNFIEVNQMEKIKVNPPNISEETMKEMVNFFKKTSIPRILAKKGNFKKR